MTPKYQRYGKKKRADYSDSEKTVVKDFKDRFSKWHTKQIDTLTFLINLLFTLSVAIAGFIIANQDKEFFKDKTVFNGYSMTRTCLVVLITSSTLGIVSLLSRYFDFSLTKDIIKVRRRIYELDNDIRYEDKAQSNKEKLIERKESQICWSTFLGRLTKVLFFIQLALFLFALWTLALYS